MALNRIPVPALYGGVSQQGANLRSAIQLEDASDTLFSVAEGASKRPPVESVRRIDDSDTYENSSFFYITGKSGTRYLSLLKPDGIIKMYRLSDGTELTSTIHADALAYITTANPNEDIRAFTINNDTYLINSGVTVTMNPDVTGGSIAYTAQTLQDSVLDAATEGSIAKIAGDTVNAFDTYYAKKVSGKFFEWIVPGITYALNANTMPMKLVLDENTLSFTLDPTVWAERQVGDAKSNKLPSFVDSKIRGVFFIGDRLGFLSGQSYSLSETGEYNNFFRTTVTDVLDTDRIDGTVSSGDASYLYWAKPVGTQMILFSESQQFSMRWDGAVTPRSLTVSPATAYPTNLKCAPKSSGTNLYFTSNTGDHATVWEMYLQDQAVTTEASNISAHVPRYIPSNLDIIETSPNFDMLFGVSPDFPSQITAHSSMWNNDERIQSAWNKWNIAGSGIYIHSIKAFDSYLFVIYEADVDPQTSDKALFLGRINLKPADAGLATGVFPHPVNTDHLRLVTGVFDSERNRTVFTTDFPYRPNSAITQLVQATGDDKGKVYRDAEHQAFVARGFITDGTTYETTIKPGSTPYKVELVGDLSAEQFFIGLTYIQKVVPSEPYVRNNGDVALSARVQLKALTIAFTNTGYFNTLVYPVGRVVPELPPVVSAYASRTVGSGAFVFNDETLLNAEFRVPVWAQSKDCTVTITNDSHLPSSFTAAEWLAVVTMRTKS